MEDKSRSLYIWRPCLQVKNSTGEDQRDGVYISSTGEEDLHGSRGTCNFQVSSAVFPRICCVDFGALSCHAVAGVLQKSNSKEG